MSSSAKPSPAPAAPAAAGDGKKAWHFIRQVTSVTRVSHETLEADPKFETFDAFLRKRQRLGRLGTNFQDSLLAEIAYVFFFRGLSICIDQKQTRQRMRHSRQL